MDNKYKRLGKNTILVFLGNAGSRVISILMLPYYTSHLSTADYGRTDIISTYSSILLSVITCCIADAIFVYPKDENETGKSKYFTSGIVFAIVSFLFLFIFSYIINSIDVHFFNSIYWWVLGLTFCMFLQSYMQQYTRCIEKMLIFSLTGVVYVISIALLAFLLLPNWGLEGYLWSLLLANIIASLFSCLTSKSYKYFKLYNFDKQYLQNLLKYGFPLIPNSVMWWLVDGINRPIMVDNLGESAIGIYAVANKFPGVLTMLFTVFSYAWSISIIEEFKKSDFNVFFNKIMRILFFIILIAAIALIMCSKFIISVFASPEFYESWKYMPILIVGVVFQNMAGLIGAIFMAEKKSKYFFYSSIWGAAISLTFTLILINVWGLTGVCISVTSSFLVMAIVRLKYAWNYINLFSIRYYMLSILLLLLFSFIYIYMEWRFFVYISCILFISILFYINKDLIKPIYKELYNKYK